MPFATKNVVRTWLFMTIFSIAAVNNFGLGEKRLDLKIGFDLTQGANGAPSLRIRDFEESAELNPRGKEDPESQDAQNKPDAKVRADSFSDSNEPTKSGYRNPDSSKESKETAKSSDDGNSDDADLSDDDKLSTRGLKAGDYEPEGNPNIHDRYEDSGEVSDKFSRRKRHVVYESRGKWRRFV